MAGCKKRQMETGILYLVQEKAEGWLGVETGILCKKRQSGGGGGDWYLVQEKAVGWLGDGDWYLVQEKAVGWLGGGDWYLVQEKAVGWLGDGDWYLVQEKAVGWLALSICMNHLKGICAAVLSIFKNCCARAMSHRNQHVLSM